jgi:hypothetical protein
MHVGHTHVDVDGRTTVCIEVRTAKNELLKLWVLQGQEEAVRQAFAQIDRVQQPDTRRASVHHSAYGWYTRYTITQHDYVGGGHPGAGGFMEVLEIQDAPSDRHGVVIHEHNSDGVSWFFEFTTVEKARAAYKQSWSLGRGVEVMPTRDGFMRSVKCGSLTPWFYAIDNEELYGDFVVPSGVADHPIYRLGRRFVLKEQSRVDFKDYDVIKTCLGCRVLPYKASPRDWTRDGNAPKQRHVIYWDDGTEMGIEEGSTGPRPLDDQEMWIDQAMQEFQKFLQGRSTRFEINLMNGDRFTGKLAPGREYDQAGTYYAHVTFAEGKHIEGTFEFTPTQEAPSVRALVLEKFKKEISKLKLELRYKGKQNKKWSGVFYGK